MAKLQEIINAIRKAVKTRATRAQIAKIRTINTQAIGTRTAKSPRDVKFVLRVSLIVSFTIATALFTYGPKISGSIPTWPRVYSFFGIDLEEGGVVCRMPLTVSFIDVGQGDCAFIRTDSCDILIDAGEPENAETVIAYLEMYGVDDLEYIIASHPHSDHVGAIPEIMEEVETETLLLSKPSSLTNDGVDYQRQLITTAKENGVKVEELGLDSNYQKSFGDLSFDVLGPIYESENLNDMSLVVRFTFGEISFLFTGDAEELEEYTILSRDYEQGGGTLKSDVLKVAHHGSSTSSTSDFIQAVNPTYAVISCGLNNDYGHPHNETIQTLTNVGADILRADLSGTIVIGSDGKQILLC